MKTEELAVLGEASYEEPKKINNVLKGVAEGVIFAFFATKATHELFDCTPLHFIFMPLLAATMTVDACLEIASLRSKRNRKLADWINVAMSITVATLVDIIVAASLVAPVLGATFVLAPYLFLGALGAMAIRTLTDLVVNVRAYRDASALATGCTESVSDVRAKYAQAMAFNIVRLLAITVMVAFVVGALITPFGQAVVLALGVAAALLAVSSAVWKIVPRDTRCRIKDTFSLFRKTDYEKLRKQERLCDSSLKC